MPDVHAAIAAHVHGMVAPPMVITAVPAHAVLTTPQPNAAAPQQAALHADPLEMLVVKLAVLSAESTSTNSAAMVTRVNIRHAMAITTTTVMAFPLYDV